MHVRSLLAFDPGRTDVHHKREWLNILLICFNSF